MKSVSAVGAITTPAACVPTLLDKPSRREAHIRAEWIGFEIPDEFVVGYGIDYAQRNRNLPYIGKVVY